MNRRYIGLMTALSLMVLMAGFSATAVRGNSDSTTDCFPSGSILCCPSGSLDACSFTTTVTTTITSPVTTTQTETSTTTFTQEKVGLIGNIYGPSFMCNLPVSGKIPIDQVYSLSCNMHTGFPPTGPYNITLSIRLGSEDRNGIPQGLNMQTVTVTTMPGSQDTGFQIVFKPTSTWTWVLIAASDADGYSSSGTLYATPIYAA